MLLLCLHGFQDSISRTCRNSLLCPNPSLRYSLFLNLNIIFTCDCALRFISESVFLVALNNGACFCGMSLPALLSIPIILCSVVKMSVCLAIFKLAIIPTLTLNVT